MDESSTLSALKTDNESNIWYKLHVLIYDLKHFKQNDLSRSRLESVVDPSYLGEPYFSQDEADKIKGALVGTDKTLSALIEETLNERLNRRMKKRGESGDYRVCAAHDIAPILEGALNIKPKDLERKQFVDMMIKYGLCLEPNVQWTGLSKQQKTFENKNGKKQRKK